MVCELNLNKADIYEGMIFASSSVSQGSSTLSFFATKFLKLFRKPVSFGVILDNALLLLKCVLFQRC